MPVRELDLNSMKMGVEEFDQHRFYQFTVPDDFTPREVQIVSGKIRKYIPKNVAYMVTRKSWTIKAMGKMELERFSNYILNILASRRVKDPKESVNIFKDGEQYCAVYGDFINLEESLAGFGDDPREALADLIKNEEISAIQTVEEQK